LKIIISSALFYVTRKAPEALDPAIVLPPRGVKHIKVTQDTSSSPCSETQQVFVWLSENQESGASDQEKRKRRKKWVLLDPMLMAELKKVTSSSFSVSDGGGEQVAGRKKGGYGKKGKGAGSRIPKVAGRRRNRGTM